MYVYIYIYIYNLFILDAQSQEAHQAPPADAEDDEEHRDLPGAALALRAWGVFWVFVFLFLCFLVFFWGV